MFAIELTGQELRPAAPFILNLDYARFRYDDRSGYLEIYYAFYPKLLTYEWSEGKYRGGVVLSTRLINNQTKVRSVDNRSVLPITEADTSGVWFRYAFITQAGYAVPFGDCTLEVVAADSLAPARRDSLSLPLQVSAYSSALDASDLEFCRSIRSSDRKTDLYFKNSLEVVPNPSLVFGVATDPVLFCYVELYNVDPAATYNVKTMLIDNDGKVVRETAKTRKYGGKNAVEVGTTNVTPFASGKYQLRFVVFDERAQELVRREKRCFVYNPHLQQAALPELSAKANELASISLEQLSAEFRQAQYVATDQEIKMFQQIESEFGKREFLAKFWVDVERGRLDRPPLKRTEYLRRVATANERFRTFTKEGWRTSRGRVFILYAEPGEIERFPSVGGTKPYEIWHHYAIEGGVEFVFVDRSGYGDYELVHSTKRGELSDESWQRFLQ